MFHTKYENIANSIFILFYIRELVLPTLCSFTDRMNVGRMIERWLP